MSDEEHLLERLAATFRPPADPLAGVVEHRRRRARRRRLGIGALSAFLVIVLVAGVLISKDDQPGHGPASTTLEAKGLQIDVPPDQPAFLDAASYLQDQQHIGASGMLDLSSCAWARPGSSEEPATGYVDQFVLAASLASSASSASQWLLVLRDNPLDLDALTRCEVRERQQHRLQLLERGPITIGGAPAIRLVFAPAHTRAASAFAPNDRDVLFLIDTGATRWALNFTAVGGGEDTMTVPAFDAVAATVRFTG